MKIANRKAGNYVRQKEVFKGNNLFSEQLAKGYVVYSYGYHFPLYAWFEVTQKWYRNIDKYSRTTSKHSSQANPGVLCEEITLEQIKELILQLQ